MYTLIESLRRRGGAVSADGRIMISERGYSAYVIKFASRPVGQAGEVCLDRATLLARLTALGYDPHAAIWR